MARKMINWMSRGTSSVPICRSGFVVRSTKGRGRRKRPVLALVINDGPGFKTLNSIIVPRVSRPIRFNTRRKNVNAIVITLGRFASPR